MAWGDLITSPAGDYQVARLTFSASVLSSMILGILQLQLQNGDAPDAALNRLNKFIHSKSSGRFAWRSPPA